MHGAQTLKAVSDRLILALASIYDIDVGEREVKLAYVQSSEPNKRGELYKKPRA